MVGFAHEKDEVSWDGSAMAASKNDPDRWKADTAQTVDIYNDWFMRFAQEA